MNDGDKVIIIGEPAGLISVHLYEYESCWMTGRKGTIHMIWVGRDEVDYYRVELDRIPGDANRLGEADITRRMYDFMKKHLTMSRQYENR
jgi:hypothetical protein